MEGSSNGGMLYHEVQESKLCAVHCVNTALQGPFFSEFDLAALASDLDRKERQMMQLNLQPGANANSAAAGDFLSEESHNVSLDGDFSIQVLQKALEVWDLQVIPLDSPVAEPAQIDPELENGFICHLHDHWFCIRKVNGEWYNFDSLYAAPLHLSKFYLSAYLDTLKGSGWSIFLVRGNFPKECPISSSEASNGYGQWLSPEDADRITKSCNSTNASRQTQRTIPRQPSDQFLSTEEVELLSEMEDEDMKAAIAASLMDSSPPVVNAGDSNVVNAGASNVANAGDSNVVNAGDSNVVNAGASNVVNAGASNVANAGDSNVANAGASNVVNAGASNVVNAGASNVANAGASNVAIAGASNPQNESSNSQENKIA